MKNNQIPDNPNIEVLKVGRNGLFKNYIFKAIPLAFDESLSYYEVLCCLLNYLKNMILPTLNNNAEAVAELQRLYEELKDYVDNYFESVDFQQLVDNKLDAMVEDGTLQNLLMNYTQIEKIYDTHEQMIADTNLVNGMKVRTMGYSESLDGGGAEYLIINTTYPEIYTEETASTNLYARLIPKDNVTVEMFGAKGDGTTDDSNAFEKALKFGLPVILKNTTYLVNYCITKNCPNIILIGDNTTIKTNVVTTEFYGHDYYGIITDDDNESTAYLTGGDVIIKNITFNGYADHILLWPYKGFGFINVYNRDNIEIDNCIFTNITNDAINIQGLRKNAKISNCKFDNVGMKEQTGSARRNAISCSNGYFDRLNQETIYNTTVTSLVVENCEFENIADECIAPRNLTYIDFKDNICKYIGHHIVENGNNNNTREYYVNIENITIDCLTSSLYNNGGDGGNNNNYKGYVTIKNVKGVNLAWKDSTALFKRNNITALFSAYNTDKSKEPDVSIYNSSFTSITPKANLTNSSTTNFIVANNVYIENSEFNYPYVEYNYIIVPYGKLIIKDSLLHIDESINRRFFLVENSNLLQLTNVEIIASEDIYQMFRVTSNNSNIYLNNVKTGDYYNIISINNNASLSGTKVKMIYSEIGDTTARPIQSPDDATNVYDYVIVTNNVVGSITYNSICNGDATFKSIINNSAYNVTGE